MLTGLNTFCGGENIGELINTFDEMHGERPIATTSTVIVEPPRLQSQPETPAQPRTTGQFFEDLADNYQHIVIAEKHHADGNEKIYGDAGFYEGLSNGGMTHIALEYPIELQTAIDAYYNKDFDYFGVETAEQISPANLVAELAGYSFKGRDYTAEDVAQGMALVIDQARSAGLSIIAMDDKASIPDDGQRAFDRQSEYIQKILTSKGVTEEQLRETLGFEDIPELSPYDYLVTTPEDAAPYLNSEELSVLDDIEGQYGQAQRMHADEAWYNHLTDALPEDARIVAIIGASHAQNLIQRDGLDERLGGDEKVATIQLAPNNEYLEAQQVKQNAYQYGGLGPGTDEPHAIITTDDMNLQSTDKINIEGYQTGDSELISTVPVEAATLPQTPKPSDYEPPTIDQLTR